MNRNALLRMAGRHRLMLLGVLGVSLGGSFTQTATRALFSLPDQPPVAFAAVVQPTGSGDGIGAPQGLAARNARRLLPGRRTLAGGPLGPLEAPAAAGAPGVGVDQFAPDGAQQPLGNPSDVSGGNGGGGQRTAGFTPGTSPLIGGGANQVVSTSAPEEIPPAVPEPPAWILGLAGLAGLGLFRHFKARSGMTKAAI